MFCRPDKSGNRHYSQPISFLTLVTNIDIVCQRIAFVMFAFGKRPLRSLCVKTPFTKCLFLYTVSVIICFYVYHWKPNKLITSIHFRNKAYSVVLNINPFNKIINVLLLSSNTALYFFITISIANKMKVSKGAKIRNRYNQAHT